PDLSTQIAGVSAMSPENPAGMYSVWAVAMTSRASTGGVAAAGRSASCHPIRSPSVAIVKSAVPDDPADACTPFVAMRLRTTAVSARCVQPVAGTEAVLPLLAATNTPPRTNAPATDVVTAGTGTPVW